MDRHSLFEVVGGTPREGEGGHRGVRDSGHVLGGHCGMGRNTKVDRNRTGQGGREGKTCCDVALSFLLYLYQVLSAVNEGVLNERRGGAAPLVLDLTKLQKWTEGEMAFW